MKRDDKQVGRVAAPNHDSQRQSLTQISDGPSKPELALGGGLSLFDARVRHSTARFGVSAHSIPPTITARGFWTVTGRATAATVKRQRQVEVTWHFSDCLSAAFALAAQHGDCCLTASAVDVRQQEDDDSASASRRVQQQSRTAHDGQTIRAANSVISNLLECTVTCMRRRPRMND